MLDLATADEYGEHFETGVTVCFTFVRNTEKAPFFGAQFLQHIEPKGRYMMHNPDPAELPRGWVRGLVCFENPLVIPFNRFDGSSYDTHNWKAELVRHFRAGGLKLTRKLVQAGHDGIVTVADGETKEIVQLPRMTDEGILVWY